MRLRLEPRVIVIGLLLVVLAVVVAVVVLLLTLCVKVCVVVIVEVTDLLVIERHEMPRCRKIDNKYFNV